MNEKITLQQGIDQFHKKNKQYFSKRNHSEKGKEFLRCHDAAHVVFGCDTTLYGEGVVKVWTTFGTTSTFWEVVTGYNEVNAFELFKMYSSGHVLKNIKRFLLAIPKVISRAKKMSKPWAFSEYEAYLDHPLSEIRREFNIQVLCQQL